MTIRNHYSQNVYLTLAVLALRKRSSHRLETFQPRHREAVRTLRAAPFNLRNLADPLERPPGRFLAAKVVQS